ncbi:hypothetical protein Bhyg_04458 [Pseudolycoriella hygida]|uniref:Uncharacterized protein n=1 Tax=Pseudolycoriella hygida TaxID=35572 RepID=A0A9Q0S8D6_9DIPT|nr:hypothetical protein Bhyg_04458 [Pseudolycoriella hygida]
MRNALSNPILKRKLLGVTVGSVPV